VSSPQLRFGAVPVVQGWGLYGLSWAVDHRTWPAYSSDLLMALYALVTVLPLTLQFLADHRSQRLGFDGLLHYTLAPISAHNVTMNVTILTEVTLAAVLMCAVIVRFGRLRKSRERNSA
jgi:hypothetical protein